MRHCSKEPFGKRARRETGKMARAFAISQQSSRHSSHPANAGLAEPWSLQTGKKRQQEVYIETFVVQRIGCSQWKGKKR